MLFTPALEAMMTPQPNFVEQSYRYLRMTLACLLLGLVAAIIWQTFRQGGQFLASVSAYYYTPAQAIFVSVLIGVGGCMIAVQGPKMLDDRVLSLGGALAAIVAIVPTPRGEDFRTAVRACKETLPTQTLPTGLDCPTIHALEAATRANVENNLFALFVIGIAALLVKLICTQGATWWKFAGASLALGLLWLLLQLFLTSLISWGHYAAAISMLMCIFFVTIRSATQPEPPGAGISRRKLYSYIAIGMLLAGAGGATLWLIGCITLFWFEILVAAAFLAFWIAQTFAPPQRTL